MLYYDPDKLWPIYDKLPEELKEAIFSENTANHINDICQRNEVGDEEMGEIAKYVGYVLLGVLKRGELSETLKEETKLTKDQIKKVSREIDRFIFFPLKASLDSIFPDEEWSEKYDIAKTEQNSMDTYRESIE